jgi:hypothetical protein
MSTSLVPTKNANGAATVRLSDDDLHRAARKGLHEANHTVFGLLPATVAQIVKHKVWKTRGRQFKTFGEYALDQTSDGLGISNNQQLWLLRCSMDVHAEHIKEWADVLEEVEQAVKAYAIEEGKRIRDFTGNSLETLAKQGDGVPGGTPRITYLPSRQQHQDGDLIRLRRNKPDVFKRVVRGELSMVEARKRVGRQVGMKIPTTVVRAKSLVRNMSDAERRDFIEWMKAEGLI